VQLDARRTGLGPRVALLCVIVEFALGVAAAAALACLCALAPSATKAMPSGRLAPCLALWHGYLSRPEEIDRMNRLSFVLAGCVAALVASSKQVTAFAATVAQAGGSMAQQLVASFDAIFHGPYPGFRANHAKGIVCEGTFTPSAAAASLSRAAHFQKNVKATVRFSNFGGVPTVPDNDDLASPHGMSVKFHLAQGGDTDLVGHSVPFFPAATPEEFNTFLQALKGGPPTVGPYLAAHAAAAQFIAAPKPPPTSFATLSYFFINAFKFTNSAGQSRYVRYTMRAVAPESSLSAAQAKQQAANYLVEEIAQRLKRGQVTFDYVAQIAGPGDPTDIATSYWPPDRERVTLGQLSITSVVANSDAVQRQLLFDPARVTDGIEPSNDPLILARSQAYAISYARRLQAKAARS
jgi:catalase